MKYVYDLFLMSGLERSFYAITILMQINVKMAFGEYACCRNLLVIRYLLVKVPFRHTYILSVKYY